MSDLPDADAEVWIGNTRTYYYHKEDCQHVDDSKFARPVTRAEAENDHNRDPCTRCYGEINKHAGDPLRYHRALGVIDDD